MVEDEKFFAWLDGELPPEEVARVEAEVSADPRLSRLADEHRAMTSGLRHAFAEVEAQPVPARLRIDRDEKVVSLADVRARRATPVWAQMAALAATLAVVLASPEALIDEMYRQDPDLAARGLGADSLQALTTVTALLVIAWSLAAIVLAVFVFRRAGWARYALLGSTGGAGGLCLVASLQAPFLVVPLLACVATFSLLLRTDVRDWFARSPSNP